MYLYSLHVAGQLTPPASTYWFSANINNNSKSLTGLLSYCQKLGLQKLTEYRKTGITICRPVNICFEVLTSCQSLVWMYWFIFFDLWLVFYNFKSNHLSIWNPMMLLYYEALSPVLFKRVKRHIILWRDHTEFNCLWGWE